jgi:DNA-binding NarL/FixJ family response regulator
VRLALESATERAENSDVPLLETRAVVIEGVPLVRAGISSVLREQNVAVVAEASSGSEAALAVRGTDAHLVVVGGPGDGSALADVVNRVKDRNRSVRVVVLVPRCTREQLLAILDAGADAIVPEDVDRDELMVAVRSARAGDRHLAAALTRVLFAAVPSPDAAAGEAPAPVLPTGVLTAREHSIVRLLAEGRTNEEIAERLFISPATVKTHLSNAYGKLGARNRYGAVVKATQQGLL